MKKPCRSNVFFTIPQLSAEKKERKNERNPLILPWCNTHRQKYARHLAHYYGQVEENRSCKALPPAICNAKYIVSESIELLCLG